LRRRRGGCRDRAEVDEALEAESLLIGRVTYESFAAAWLKRSGEFAEKMNVRR
jgi:hypothetical protein